MKTLTGHKSCGSKEAPEGRRGRREGGEARLGLEGMGLATLMRLPAKVTRMKWLMVTFSEFFVRDYLIFNIFVSKGEPSK